MAALQVLEEAAQLGFVSPPTGILSDTGSGEQVAIAWNTPYDLTNLEVWLGPADDGSFVVNVLGANLTRDTTTYMWALPSAPTDAYHFRLQKGDQPNDCDACVASSPTFHVEHPEPVPVSSSTSSSISASSTPTAPSTSIQIAAAAAATPTTSSTAAAESSSGISHETTLGVGVGIGLGVPIIMILLFLLMLSLLKRQNRQQKMQQLDNVRKKQQETQTVPPPFPTLPRPPPPCRVPPGSADSTGADSWTTISSGKTQSYHGPFEFEYEMGRVKPGWERLFGRNGLPYFAMPVRTKSGRLMFRS
ncbi:hypothetical protein SMMN14_08791 [Sphaerulina musiva]